MSDCIRIGKIHAIDYKNGTASVIYSDRNNQPSPYFPFFSFTYEIPKVDETVVVILLSNSTSKGFIVGVPWSSKKKPTVSGSGIFYKEFPDKSFIKYDSKSRTMEVSAKNIRLHEVTAENVTVKGKLNAREVIAENALITKLEVLETAAFKDLSVSGTANIENLNVTGTASGNFTHE